MTAVTAATSGKDAELSADDLRQIAAHGLDEAEVRRQLDLLAGGTVRDAAAALSAETGLPRRALYTRALARSRAREGCAVDP